MSAGADAPGWLRGPVTLVGHPFAPIGMGEQMRSHIAALAAAGAEVQVYDIYRYAERGDPAHRALVEPREVSRLGPLRIFHLNGDEVEEALRTLAARGEDFAAGHNIIVPAWELPVYPAAWAAQLGRFDEVWALSRFLRDSLAAGGVVPGLLVGQSAESDPGPLLPRRHFGLREDAFVLLHFLDLSSYASRKNPEAVLALFRRVAAREAASAPGRPGGRPLHLVLKVKDAAAPAEAWAEAQGIAGEQVTVIARPLDTLETRSLIGCCDLFVSLHRAEGFGRGTAEAMALGRLAMATGWSGNLDHMDEANALLVRHRLVPVPEGAYPHASGQRWAEPELDHAVALLERARAEPAWAAALAARGCRDVRLRFSHRAIGVRALRRLAEIEATMGRTRRGGGG